VTGGEDRGGVRGGGDPDRGADVAEVARGLEEDDRAGAFEGIREVEVRAPGDRQDLVGREPGGHRELPEAAR
jgi:hypothetical protein